MSQRLDVTSLRTPIVAAPMAGGPSTPELVAAVNDGGGLGFLAAGYRTAEGMAEQIEATRALTSEPFGVNLFTPQRRRSIELSDEIEAYRDLLRGIAAKYGVEPGEPHFDDDDFSNKIEYLCKSPVPLVTFTFGGVDSSVLRRLRDAGTLIGFAVTSADEAREAEALGSDLLIAQGANAGGHRATWSSGEEPNNSDTDTVLRSVRAVTDIPVFAAGGVGTPDDVARLLKCGAAAVCVGTAFVASTESASPQIHKEALTSGQFTSTTVTRAFSGRYARGLTNEFIKQCDHHVPAAYPDVHYISSPIRKAAAQQGDPEGIALWAGSGHQYATIRSASQIIEDLTS